MQFIDPVSNWTNGTGDTLNVSMGPMPTLPISIWTQTGGTGDAQVHLGSAGPIYNDMQCGIGFDGVVPIIEAAALDTLTASCNDLRPVKAVGFTPGRLNIYYVQDIRDTDDARGIHCETTDHDVILINRSIAPIPTFSHEVGHALTLVHTNDVPGLNTYTEIEPGLFECNLMLFAGTNQRPLSTGQCFRANLNSESAINRLGARTGPKPGCDRVNSSRECPQLAFDVVPK